jgi:hypothetical protein
MDLSQAKLVLRNPTASYAQQVEAAAAVAASKKSEIADLIRCLRIGGHPAEIVATALYTRTGRPYSGQLSDFSTDPEEWSRYLAQQLEAAAK